MAQATSTSGNVGTGGTSLGVKVHEDEGAAVDALVAIVSRKEEEE
jgi:hypothetical protein